MILLVDSPMIFESRLKDPNILTEREMKDEETSGIRYLLRAKDQRNCRRLLLSYPSTRFKTRLRLCRKGEIYQVYC